MWTCFSLYMKKIVEQKIQSYVANKWQMSSYTLHVEHKVSCCIFNFGLIVVHSLYDCTWLWFCFAFIEIPLIKKSICLSIYLSIYPSIHLSIYLSIYLSISSAIFLHFSVFPSDISDWVLASMILTLAGNMVKWQQRPCLGGFRVGCYKMNLKLYV